MKFGRIPYIELQIKTPDNGSFIINKESKIVKQAFLRFKIFGEKPLDQIGTILSENNLTLWDVDYVKINNEKE